MDYKFWNWKKKIEKKDNPIGSAIVNLTHYTPIWTSQDYISMVTEGYLDNPYVYACINVITKACGQIDFILYQKDSKGKRKIIEQHELLNLLNNPNPEQGKYAFIKEMISYYLLADNAFITYALAGKKPKELYNLRPDRIHVFGGYQYNLVDHYTYYTGTDEITLKARDVMHLKDFAPLKDYEGCTPIRACAKSIDQNNACRAWNTALLQNGANQPGILVSETELDDANFARLKSEISAKFSNVDRAGVPALLEGKILWYPTGMNPKDIDWTEAIKLSAKEIANAFGVPPECIGDSSNKTYSNYQEARKALYQETILPIMGMLVNQLNVWLTPFFGTNLEINYDIDSIPALAEDRKTLFDAIKDANYLTKNEKREMMGFDPIEGGDVLDSKLPLPKTTTTTIVGGE